MTTYKNNYTTLLTIGLLFIHFFVYSNNIYVAKTGNDSNPGTEDLPYLTISKAATVAVAGDIVYIKAGTYEETLTPTNSGTDGNPIIFQSYPGDKVIISAMEALSGWTQSEGAIYKTTIPFSSLSQENFVMNDQTALNYARWPNKTTSDPFVLNSIRNTGGSDGTVEIDAYLTESSIPNIDWTGGAVWFYGDKPGSGWTAWKRTIKSSSTGKVTFDLTFNDSEEWVRTYHAPADLGDFFLEGAKAALDYENEWYYDENSGELFVQLPSGLAPIDGEVKMRRRLETINLKDKKYIHIKNLAVFGGTINMEDSSTWHTNGNNRTTNNLLYGISSFYGNHTLGVAESSRSGKASISMQGSNNTIEKCEIAFNAGAGIQTRGNNITIKDNYIHDFDFLSNYDAPLVARGIENSTIINNTIFNGGRDCIQYAGSNNVVSYNDVSQSNRLADDCALFYTVGAQPNTEIHHNWFHDTESSGTKSKAAGIYLDNDAESFIVHHNVVWNTEWTNIQINWNGKDIEIYNNTLFNGSAVMGAWHLEGTEFTNVKVWNNLGGDSEWEPQSDQQNNITTTSASFVDSANGNFNLVAESEAINAGKLIPGYTDGFIGEAPDVGAYEYSATEWVAGMTWDHKYSPTGLGCYGLPGEDCENIIDELTWNPRHPTLNANNSLEIPFTYSSDTEIEPGGILFTFWVVQPSPWWHQWKAQYKNTTTLPIGHDVQTSMIITPPADVSTDGIIWTTDELQVKDINNSGETYRYELRMLAGSDTDFTPTLPDHSYVTVAESLSIDKNSVEQIKIYPNPTTGIIFISDIKDATFITVTNLIGKHVMTLPISDRIDLSHLPKGIYIIRTDNGILRKIIKN